MPIHLPNDLAAQLADLAKQHSAQRLVLFSSRARGDHKERSNIDLAVYGMSRNEQADFWMDADETALPNIPNWAQKSAPACKGGYCKIHLSSKL